MFLSLLLLQKAVRFEGGGVEIWTDFVPAAWILLLPSLPVLEILNLSAALKESRATSMWFALKLAKGEGEGGIINYRVLWRDRQTVCNLHPSDNPRRPGMVVDGLPKQFRTGKLKHTCLDSSWMIQALVRKRMGSRLGPITAHQHFLEMLRNNFKTLDIGPFSVTRTRLY